MKAGSLDYRPMVPASGAFAFFGATSSPPTFAKIESFRRLPVGWHYGEGGPVDDAVIGRAHDLLTLFLMIGLTRTDAFVGAGREILLAAYDGDHYVGVIVEPDGTFALTHEVADQEIRDCESIGLLELKLKLLEVAKEVGSLKVARGTWSSSDSSTGRISTKYGVGSMTSASRTFEARSQWSIGNVWMPPASRFALMQEGTTRP